MDSSISDCVKELKNINLEIMRIQQHAREQVKKLKPRKMELENKIQNYLEENDREGLRYGSTVILLAEKKKTVGPRKKKDKLEAVGKVLTRYGFSSPNKAAEELFRTLKGDVQKVPCLKIKQIKYDYSDLI